jgi:hypothetical protein
MYVSVFLKYIVSCNVVQCWDMNVNYTLQFPSPIHRIWWCLMYIFMLLSLPSFSLSVSLSLPRLSPITSWLAKKKSLFLWIQHYFSRSSRCEIYFGNLFYFLLYIFKLWKMPWRSVSSKAINFESILNYTWQFFSLLQWNPDEQLVL